MHKTKLLFFVLISTISCYGQSKYVGDKLLQVLGQVKDSTDLYKEFARDWGMGKKTSLPEKGFKISKNSETKRVIALTFAGKGFELGDIKFQKFEGQMPFGLNMDDNYTSLRTKLGAPKKDVENVSKFSKNGLSIIATFKNSSKTKLEFIKIALGFGQTEYDPSQFEVITDNNSSLDNNSNKYSKEPTYEEMKTAAENQKFKENSEAQRSESSTHSSSTKEAASHSTSSTSRTKSSPEITTVTPATFDNAPAKPKPINSSKSDFYKSIMEVMESGSESYFASIQSGSAVSPVTNFWSYKHTFKTNLNIAGTKYNFIYSFPFANSQKDWVAVIKEGAYDASFQSTYNDYLEKIKRDFPASEGWKYSFPKDEDPNFPLKDFEAQNNKFGSLILDYHKSPEGQSVLYLRLLLYYD